MLIYLILLSTLQWRPDFKDENIEAERLQSYIVIRYYAKKYKTMG